MISELCDPNLNDEHQSRAATAILNVLIALHVLDKSGLSL